MIVFFCFPVSADSQNGLETKSVGINTCYPFHTWRLLHCPKSEERATKKPHANMNIQYKCIVHNHIKRASTVALFR